MKNSNISVGLDIGTSNVMVVVGRKAADSKVEIIGVGRSNSLGVNRGVILNISQTIASIASAVKAAEEQSGVKIRDVIVGIAGQHIRSQCHTDYIVREHSGRVITQDDIDKLISQAYNAPTPPGEKVIHVLPQEYKVDAEVGIIDPVGMSGKRVEGDFHVVIGQIPAILNITRCVRDAGLNPIGIKLEQLASADAVLTDMEKEAGVVLVDMGGGTTDIAVISDNIIRHTAIVPTGGKVVTLDIKETCDILGKYAEKLKVEFGSAWPGENKETDIVSVPMLAGIAPREISMKQLSRIIYRRMDQLIDEINIEIANYRRTDPGRSLMGGIVITGGGASLRHLPQLVQYKTSMPCRVGMPDVFVTEQSRDLVSDPSYSTCVGLVINGLKDPDEEQDEQVEELQVEMPSVEDMVVDYTIDELMQGKEPEAEEQEEEVDEQEEEEDQTSQRPKRNIFGSIEKMLNNFIKNIE